MNVLKKFLKRSIAPVPKSSERSIALVPKSSKRSIAPVPKSSDRSITPVPKSSEMNIVPVPTQEAPEEHHSIDVVEKVLIEQRNVEGCIEKAS